MLENTEGAIKNKQSREIGNIGYTRRTTTTTKHYTIASDNYIGYCERMTILLREVIYSFLSLLLNWHWKAVVMIYICLVSGRAIGSLMYGHSPCIKRRLSTWARWAVALGPTNIGAHANLCMLYTTFCFLFKH